jgi:glycosyltransferase involved in cell wall biosynthesis
MPTNLDHPLLSIVVPIRNRAGTRLANCLHSLRWQDLRGKNSGESEAAIEIIVSDFGSDSPHKEEIAALADEVNARVVRAETTEIWNRSRVLNIGIRASRGQFVLCTDADMVFKPNFAQSALDLQERAGERGAMVLCQCHDLPESLDERRWEKDQISGLFADGTVRGFGGTGACQCAPRAFFEYARGYDEGYVFWGSEDKDMVARAERHGLELLWLDEHTAMAHQWHPTLRADRKWLVLRNRLRYKLTKHRVVKNRGQWGVPSEK